MIFENTQPGDEVIVHRPDGTLGLCKVERLTSTQVIVNGYRYRRSDGVRKGDSGWSLTVLHLPTPELRAEVARQSAHRTGRSLLGRIREQSDLGPAVPHLRAALAALQEAS
jgi:hypothetical protein